MLDTNKLLPGSTDKGGTIVAKFSQIKFETPRGGALALQSSQAITKTSVEPEVKLIKEKVTTLAQVFKKRLDVTKTLNKKEKIEKENEKRKKAEVDLEKSTKKETKGESVNLPGQSLLDKIIRFLGFTALGFLVDKFGKYATSIQGALPVIETVINGIAGFVTSIGNAAITFVERGYAAYDAVQNAVKSIGGDDAEAKFTEFSGLLNKVLNGAIIAATIALSTRPRTRVGGGVRAPQTRIRGVDEAFSAGRPRRMQPSGTTSRGAAQRYLQRYGQRAATRRFGAEAVKSIGPRAAARVIKPFVSRLPIIGGLIEFAISWATGDPVGKAAFRGIGATLVGGIGTVVGGPIGAILGGMVGGEIGALLYDAFFTGKQTPAEPEIATKQSGGQVTRGGKDVTRVTRGFRRETGARGDLRQKVVPTRRVSIFKSKNIVSEDINVEEFYGLKGYKNIIDSADVISGNDDNTNKFFSGLFSNIIGMLIGQPPQGGLANDAAMALASDMEKNLNIPGKPIYKYLKKKLLFALEKTQNIINQNIIKNSKITETKLQEYFKDAYERAQPRTFAPRTGAASGVQLDPEQPGVDFTPEGGNNKAVFPGEVVEIGHQYNPNGRGGDGRKGAGYGNFVVIRSEDPKKPGTFFDGLYAHFPDGEIKVKVGDMVTAGQILGRMATAAEFADPMIRKRVGSGTGAHTSLDFLLPGSNEKYPDYIKNLVPLVDPTFSNQGNQSFLPVNMRPSTDLQQGTTYTNAYGMQIIERNTILYQKEVVLT